jgi:hypothetical protein
MFAPLVSAISWFALAVRIGAPPAVAADDPSVTDPTDTAHGALPDGTPPRFGTAMRPPVRLGAKILYVNFDGADMNGCFNNDPHNDCSTIFDGVVLPYSGDATKRASVIQILRNRVEDFGITVTNQRPADGDYDMEMVGNWQGEQPGFAGVAPNIDCFDNDGGEVSFTLESSGTADGIAEIVLQEAAHTWGLEHVNDGGDLLFPTTSGTNKTFVDECFKIVSDTSLNESNGICNQVHTEFCNSGWQNSYQELLFVFGESVADMIAPTVAIAAPADGAMVSGDFDVVVDIADDQSPVVMEMTLTLSGGALAEPASVDGAYAGPSSISFPIEDLPDGEYTVLVEGLDESGNAASDQITITVATESGDDTTSATGPVDDTSGGSTDPDPTDPDPTAPDPTTTPDPSSESRGESTDTGAVPTADSGCGCGSTAAPPPSQLVLLALVPFLRRRRVLGAPP